MGLAGTTPLADPRTGRRTSQDPVPPHAGEDPRPPKRLPRRAAVPCTPQGPKVSSFTAQGEHRIVRPPKQVTEELRISRSSLEELALTRGEDLVAPKENITSGWIRVTPPSRLLSEGRPASRAHLDPGDAKTLQPQPSTGRTPRRWEEARFSREVRNWEMDGGGICKLACCNLSHIYVILVCNE